MLQSGHCTTGIFNDKGIHNVDFDLAEGKGNVDEDCNEDFVGDPGQARKTFTHSNNLMSNKLVSCWIIKMLML